MTSRFPIHGSRVALLGTSLVQQNHLADPTHIRTCARGWASWTEVLSGGRLHIPVHHDPLVHTGWEPCGRPNDTRGFGGLNAGVSGQKARDIAARIDEVLALDFDLIIVDAGTNDMMVETREEIQSLREEIADRLLTAGRTVILLPILARGTEKWPAGGPERAKAHWINQRSLAFTASRPGCHLFDWNVPWVDWASPDGVPCTGFSDDGTHFSVPGGFAVGKALVAYLDAFLAPATPRRWARDDRFDPVDNPFGNLVSNSLLAGAGPLADGLALHANTHVPTRLAPADGGPMQSQEISLAAGECRLELLGERFTNPLPAGAWVEASCALQVEAYDGWRDISLELQDGAPDGLTAEALAPFALSEGEWAPFPAEAWSGVLRTPPIKLKTSGHPLKLALRLRSEMPAPGYVRLSLPIVRQVHRAMATRPFRP